MKTLNNQTKKELLDLLSEVLGSYHEYTKQKEIAFYCPECNHRKRKLNVNLETGNWHCWVCEVDNNMRGRSVYTLFKRVGANSDAMSRLNDILGTSTLFIKKSDEQSTVIKRLPSEYIPLWKPNKSPYYKHAMNYLKKRGITSWDIIKYNIGYAEEGDYKNKIIIPSYDVDGRLNFFVGREFYNQNAWELHKIPEGWSKDVVGFELFVNWNMPIVLVEGVFDAFAIKRNAIPLFGKTVMETLKQRIVQHDVKDIYVALDADASLSIHRIAKRFVGEGRNVYTLNMDNKDPSKIGFVGMMDLMNKARQESQTSVIELRLKSMIKKPSLL